MKPHAFINSDPSAFDSNCAQCGGKDRDNVHRVESEPLDSPHREQKGKTMQVIITFNSADDAAWAMRSIDEQIAKRDVQIEGSTRSLLLAAIGRAVSCDCPQMTKETAHKARMGYPVKL